MQPTNSTGSIYCLSYRAATFQSTSNSPDFSRYFKLHLRGCTDCPQHYRYKQKRRSSAPGPCWRAHNFCPDPQLGVDNLCIFVNSLYKVFLCVAQRNYIRRPVVGTYPSPHPTSLTAFSTLLVIITIIQTFVRRTLSVSEPNLRRRQSLGGEDG